MRIHAKFILFSFFNSDDSGQQFRQALSEFRDPAQTSSSSKNASPFCDRKKLFDLTGNDPQCFSHKDGCFAAGNELQGKPIRTIII